MMRRAGRRKKEEACLPDRQGRRADRRGIFYFSSLLPLSASLFFVFLLSLPLTARAEELKIVFTGQAYSMLYPCTCPHEPDGGVSRRAAFIKMMRAASKNVLVVEAGGSFASGSEDQYAQNAESDRRRSEIYLKALGAMRYDALLVSGQEYAFGEDFLKKQNTLPFLTSNMERFARWEVVRDFGGFKVAVLGLTEEGASAKGIAGWQAPSVVLKERVRDVKKRGADVVVVLSSLTPDEDKALLADATGIDVVINGRPSLGAVNMAEVDGAVHLATWWQARRVGVLTLEVAQGKVLKKRLESFRLSADVGEEEAVSKFLPVCFSDKDCAGRAAGPAGGGQGRCENPGAADARCVVAELPAPLSLAVIQPRVCSLCRSENVIVEFTHVFGPLNTRTLFEDEAEAREMIDAFGISMLPAYIFGKDVEQAPAFSSFVKFLQKGNNSYMLKPAHAGVSYFLNTERIPKRLDLFFDFDYKNLSELFQLLKRFREKHKDIGVGIHFLAMQDNDGTFLAKGGVREAEEFSRAACVGEEYPDKFLEYLICRAAQKDSSWWDDCASSGGIDAAKIKACVFSAKGGKAMRSRTALTEKLKLASGPVFVVDNKEVFSVAGVPSLEEFEAVALGQKKEAGKEKR